MSWKILLIAIPLSVQARETVLQPIEVESIKDIELFTFTSSETISERNIEAQPTGIVSPLLEKVPGLVASQNGGPGGRVSYFLRGTESRHISFTLDGLKINDPSNTDRQFDAAFFTSTMVKEISVYKGPQAVLYGSDAMGGLVEMKSRKGDHAPETRLSIQAGSFGTAGSTLANDWQSKSSKGTVTATRFHTDGISRVSEKRFGAREKDATDITHVSSSSEHRWAPRVQTEVLASYLHGRSEQDGFQNDNSYDYSRNDQYLIQQKTSLELQESQVLSLRNGLNRHQRYNRSLVSKEEFFNGNLYQHELVHRLDKGAWAFLSGLASEHENAKAKNFDRSFDLHSAFLQGSFRTGELRFHAGGRRDQHSRYGSFLTGSGGVGYGEFSFQYSQGYKAPSLYQLYGPDSFGSPVGNPDLKPETNHFLELYWKRVRDVYETKVAMFQNRLSNLFTFQFGRGYFNQQRFISEGVELEGKIRQANFELMGSFTHQQFKDEEAPVLLRPYNIAQLGISYFPQETLELNISSRWYSARRDFSAKLNGFEVVDLGVRKSWERDDVSLQLKNLFNREYEELYGFSVLPRSLFANYSHRF